MDLTGKKILISIPCRDTVSVDFACAILSLMKPCECHFQFESSGLVFDARDMAALTAIALNYDYVLFIDADMAFNPDALLMMLAHDDPVITGLYYKRKGNHEPVLCKQVEMRRDDIEACAITETDIDGRDYFQVEGCGFGFCLIKTEVFEKVLDYREEHHGARTAFEPLPGMGEDYSFCYVLKELGIPIMCDSTIWLGHCGTYVYDKKDWRREPQKCQI